MTKEQLLAAGLSEAQTANVLKLHKEALDGNYIPKHRFDEVSTELKTTKEQITERDKQIDGLKKFEGDSKALSDKIKEMETSNATKDAEYKKSLAQERKQNSIKLTLLEDENGKPHDVNMVMSLFKLDQIVVDETTGKPTSGFKEQYDSIRKEKAFLFAAKEEAKPGTPGWKPAGNPPPDGNPDKGKDDKPDVIASAYGKSLAASRLQQMGIKPVETSTGKTN